MGFDLCLEKGKFQLFSFLFFFYHTNKQQLVLLQHLIEIFDQDPNLVLLMRSLKCRRQFFLSGI